MSSGELNELLSILAATDLKIQSLLENRFDQQLRRRPSEGEFSLVENVCHLRDLELEGYTTRIKQILGEDDPVLADIDGGRLAVERDYNKQDVQAALRSFSFARRVNIDTLKSLGPEELSRAGTFEGIGKINLADLIRMMRDHDASHLKEMEIHTPDVGEAKPV